jgi:hypothetical protein
MTGPMVAFVVRALAAVHGMGTPGMRGVAGGIPTVGMRLSTMPAAITPSWTIITAGAAEIVRVGEVRLLRGFVGLSPGGSTGANPSIRSAQWSLRRRQVVTISWLAASIMTRALRPCSAVMALTVSTTGSVPRKECALVFTLATA